MQDVVWYDIFEVTGEIITFSSQFICWISTVHNFMLPVDVLVVRMETKLCSQRVKASLPNNAWASVHACTMCLTDRETSFLKQKQQQSIARKVLQVIHTQ